MVGLAGWGWNLLVISHLWLNNQLQNLNQAFLRLKLESGENWSVQLNEDADVASSSQCFAHQRMWLD